MRSCIFVAVVCGCSVSSVRIRDEEGRVRAVLDVEGLALFDREGSERATVRVGEDGRPAILLWEGKEQVRLGATDDGWELIVGETGREPTVMLLAPDGDQPYLKLGQVTLGYERRPARGDAPPGTIETNREKMGLTFVDDDCRERLFLGTDGPNWGVSLRDDKGERRAELWTTHGDGESPVVAWLLSEGRKALTLSAGKHGGWIEAAGASDSESALMAWDKVRIQTARAEAELTMDAKCRPIVRVRSIEGAQVEVAIDDGKVPYVELKDAKGEVQRFPPK